MGLMGEFDRPRPGAVLIVDDDEDMCALLASLARSLGADRVIEAHGVCGALASLEAEAVTAVVIDLCLGPASGVEVISAIRRHRRSRVRATPIIAISGKITQDHTVAAMLAGADTFMSKPITIEKLEKHFSIAVTAHRSAPVSSAAARAQAPRPVAFLID